MKKLIVFYLILGCCSLWAQSTTLTHNPEVTFAFPYSYPATVYNDVDLRIRMHMHFDFLENLKVWGRVTNAPVVAVNISGKCPLLTGDKQKLNSGDCYMDIIIPRKEVGSVTSGYMYLKVGKDFIFTTPVFAVTVIPHPLSMDNIEEQKGTVGVNFVYDFKAKAVKYYSENRQAGKLPIGDMAAEDLKKLADIGLRFDPVNLIIQGKPTKIGMFHFKLGARNNSSVAAAHEYVLDVGADKNHTPVFRKQLDFASATPTKNYKLNLLSLLEPKTNFNDSNQISFQIIENKEGWLKISATDPNILEGITPTTSTAHETEITLVASSNTGGNSQPEVIKIPIAIDPTQRPTIDHFKLTQLAGNQMYADIFRNIKDPTNDPNLKIIIDKIEPAAAWLSVSSERSTVLEGYVGEQLTGQKYLITLRVSNTVGGSSEPITVPLQIDFDRSRTPRFRDENPQLPIVYPGQPFIHDFVFNQDIFPEYQDAPYEIQFANDYEHPPWLKIENNRLYAELVPINIRESTISINIVIKNKPGGESQPITLDLKVMN